MSDDRLQGALQENVLTVLVFSKKYAAFIRHAISPRLFENAIYQDIAERASEFIDQFNDPIGEHLPDVLEHILKGEDARKARSYEMVLDNIFQSKDSVNEEYVAHQISSFVRAQNLKMSILRSAELVERGEVDEAEVEIQKGLSSQVSSFDAGLEFKDPKQTTAFLDIISEVMPTGIAELDKRGIGPARKEMFLLIAPPKKGKTWGLMHMGKFLLLNRYRVLHVTLEMSELRVAQRYVQSFFSMSKRAAQIQVPKLEVDTLGRITDITSYPEQRPSFEDPNARAYITSRLKRDFRRRPTFMIKEFPTGSLTVSMLEAYLDSLERFRKFVPDVIILDYPDLMEVDDRNLRVSLTRAFEKLRGLAVTRNMALIVASQGNRSSASAKVITDDMVAEAFGKIATADTVITYNQTPQEKQLGLARLFVSNSRNEEDKFSILITQSYPIGQFCLDSAYMTSDYWDMVDSSNGGEGEEK